MLSQLVGLGVGMASSVVLARGLGVQNRGILAAAMLLSSTAQIFGGAGAYSAIVHFTASKRWSTIQLGPNTMAIWWIVSVLVTAFGAVALLFRSTVFPEVPWEFLFASLLICTVQILGSFLSGILTAYQKFGDILRLSIPLSLTSLLLLYFVLFVLHLGVAGVLGAQAICAFISILLYRLKIRSFNSDFRMPITPFGRFGVLKDALTYGAKSQLGNIAGFLNYRADQFIINYQLGVGPLGVYTVGVNNAEKLWMVASNFSTVLFPMVSEDRTKDSKIDLFTARLGVITLFFTALAGIFVTLISVPAVLFLYGSEFRGSAGVIACLMPGVVFLAYGKIFANFIAARGRPEINAYSSIGSALFNIIGNIALIPFWGIKGAAVASSLSYIALAFYTLFAFRKITLLAWSEILWIPPDDLKLYAKRGYTGIKNYFLCSRHEPHI